MCSHSLTCISTKCCAAAEPNLTTFRFLILTNVHAAPLLALLHGVTWGPHVHACR